MTIATTVLLGIIYPLVVTGLAQLFFKDKAKGSGIPSISISSIEEMELSIPDIEKQRTILNLSKLRVRERQIRQQLTILRDNYIQQQLLNSIKK